MDTLTLVLVIQAIVLALFVWLLWDTRKEARAREQRSGERELQLLAVAQTLSNQLPTITNSLQQIERRLEYWGKQESGKRDG